MCLCVRVDDCVSVVTPVTTWERLGMEKRTFFER